MRKGSRLRIAEGLVWRPALALALVLAACSAIPPHPEVEGVGQGFSGALVRAHLDALAPLFPRAPDAPADRIARAYLSRELQLAGAEVRTLQDGDRRHLVAEIQGFSPDRLLLVAAYPALESGRWIDDSGAALLLELARFYGRAAPAYTLELALAELRADGSTSVGGVDGGPRRASIRSSADARRSVGIAGESLARAVAAEARPGRIRALVSFELSARGRPRIALDLRSQPGLREVFWDSARDLGFGAVFPSDADWSSPVSLHLGFRRQAMDRVLALVDDSLLGSGLSAPPPEPDSPALHGSLEPVGLVSVEALGRLMRRFEKVDAFAR